MKTKAKTNEIENRKAIEKNELNKKLGPQTNQ